jgi:hypothetical protein
MLRERYQYYYKANGNDYMAMMQFSTRAVEWMSGISITFGASARLSPQWSAFALPNLVVPVLGLGQGQVKLKNAGLRLGLTHALPGKRK